VVATAAPFLALRQLPTYTQQTTTEEQRQVNNINIPKEFGRAAIAAVVAFFAALLLKALGAGKWLTASASGAVGGIAAVAVLV
jgi:uncharacterized membrane protein YjjP (DUF1212 family)